jgi:hypothetical protein
LRKSSATPKCFAQNSKNPEFTGWKFQRKKQAAKKLFSSARRFREQARESGKSDAED